MELLASWLGDLLEKLVNQNSTGVSFRSRS
jgi:hypothetical protein